MEDPIKVRLYKPETGTAEEFEIEKSELPELQKVYNNFGYTLSRIPSERTSTLGTFAGGILQGASYNFEEEIYGKLGGEEVGKEAEKQRQMEMEERPLARVAGEVVGSLVPGLGTTSALAKGARILSKPAIMAGGAALGAIEGLVGATGAKPQGKKDWTWGDVLPAALGALFGGLAGRSVADKTAKAEMARKTMALVDEGEITEAEAKKIYETIQTAEETAAQKAPGEGPKQLGPPEPPQPSEIPQPQLIKPVPASEAGQVEEARRIIQERIKQGTHKDLNVVDNKVVDQTGSPVTVYRGSSVEDPFSTKDKRGWYYFTDNPVISRSYAGKTGYITEAQIELKNPLIVDANGSFFRRVPVQTKQGMKEMEADKIAKQAQKAGYDGVIIKNIQDPGPRAGVVLTPEEKLGTNVIVFDRKNVVNPQTSRADLPIATVNLPRSGGAGVNENFPETPGLSPQMELPPVDEEKLWQTVMERFQAETTKQMKEQLGSTFAPRSFAGEKAMEVLPRRGLIPVKYLGSGSQNDVIEVLNPKTGERFAAKIGAFGDPEKPFGWVGLTTKEIPNLRLFNEALANPDLPPYVKKHFQTFQFIDDKDSRFSALLSKPLRPLNKIEKEEIEKIIPENWQGVINPNEIRNYHLQEFALALNELYSKLGIKYKSVNADNVMRSPKDNSFVVVDYGDFDFGKLEKELAQKGVLSRPPIPGKGRRAEKGPQRPSFITPSDEERAIMEAAKQLGIEPLLQTKTAVEVTDPLKRFMSQWSAMGESDYPIATSQVGRGAQGAVFEGIPTQVIEEGLIKARPASLPLELDDTTIKKLIEAAKKGEDIQQTQRNVVKVSLPFEQQGAAGEKYIRELIEEARASDILPQSVMDHLVPTKIQTIPSAMGEVNAYVMPKLLPLTKQQRDHMRSLFPIGYEEVRRRLHLEQQVGVPSDIDKLKPEFRELYDALLKIKQTTGIGWEDVHQDNVMFNPANNKIVVIDPGLFSFLDKPGWVPQPPVDQVRNMWRLMKQMKDQELENLEYEFFNK